MKTEKDKVARCLTAIILLSLMLPAWLPAVPSFARKYKTSCVTCHYAFPKLNAFGRAFLNNGYRIPGGKEARMRKEKPIKMGADAYKKLWPRALWPTDIPGATPLSVHAVGRVHYFEAGKNSSFEIPHQLETIFAGTFDQHFSFFAEVKFLNQNNVDYEFKFQYDFNSKFHLKMGTAGLEEVVPLDRRIAPLKYNLSGIQNRSGTWDLTKGAGGGIELWGAGNGPHKSGGFTFALGLGNGQINRNNLDTNNHKDFYGRFTYKFGGVGEAGGIPPGWHSNVNYYTDNSLRLGGFFYSGSASDSLGRDNFHLFGADLDAWWYRINLFAELMWFNSDYGNIDWQTRAGFIETNILVFPWLFLRTRYEQTDMDSQDARSLDRFLLPSVVALVRANVKGSVEYKLPLNHQSENDGHFVFQFDFAF